MVKSLYVLLDEEGYINHASQTRNSDLELEMKLPDDHEAFDNPFIFNHKNGELSKDKQKQEKLVKEKKERRNKPSLEARLNELEKRIQALEGK